MFPLICSLDRFPLPMTKDWPLQAGHFDGNDGKLAVMPLRELARKRTSTFWTRNSEFQLFRFLLSFNQENWNAEKLTLKSQDWCALLLKH